MANWEQVVRTIVDGVNDFKVVYEFGQVGSLLTTWLAMDTETAKSHISYFVQSAATSQIDMMDHCFIHGALPHVLTGNQPRLMLYYAWFKMHELARYQQFRGFPRID